MRLLLVCAVLGPPYPANALAAQHLTKAALKAYVRDSDCCGKDDACLVRIPPAVSRANLTNPIHHQNQYPALVAKSIESCVRVELSKDTRPLIFM